MGSAGFFLFFVFLFHLPRKATNRLRKGHINRDLSSKAVAKTASVKNIIVVLGAKLKNVEWSSPKHPLTPLQSKLLF
jgi:hypothetical protein